MIPLFKSSSGLFPFHLLILISLPSCIISQKPGSVGCYFAMEFQGTFLMQTQAMASAPASSVTYSEITIEADSIPPWGDCHKKFGNKVILRDSDLQDCMRCFHITLKTPNVIEMHTEGLARCYTNEEAARATCPTERDVREGKFKEIILFRKHVPGGLESIQHVFCPINGRYNFNYISRNKNYQCPQSHSEISNCPHGNRLDLQFRECTFPTMDTHFLCLGDWLSANGDRYLALMDLREDPKNSPKYRCGLYREDPKTRRIHVSMSLDSTCMNHPKSVEGGYESFILTPREAENKLPDKVKMSKCGFPEWTQGKWETAKIDGSTFRFKDERNQFQTLTSKCIQRQNNTPNDRFIIFSRNQCGKEYYTCVWMKRRSPNILEFQFGEEKSLNYSHHLCDDTQFVSHSWVTQGRKNVGIATACPITGDYVGVVPGVNGICAKVASDCNNPDIMFYTVSSCENRSHVLEEREYRCLGNWEEDGSLYTYTQRRDMSGHQCFAGKIVKNGNEAFIKEAGHNCIRGEDPMIFGMKIIKQANCPRLAPVTSYIPLRRNWNNRARKIIPHKPQIYKTMRHMIGRDPIKQETIIFDGPVTEIRTNIHRRSTKAPRHVARRFHPEKKISEKGKKERKNGSRGLVPYSLISLILFFVTSLIFC